ncbi:MAG: hypothetical protein EPN38_11390 [Rhodanobacteraceae bacterium]|nr:MAG: hypothetical protein EPN38_11390 [Rhodanobacteraceae bacterium]
MNHKLLLTFQLASWLFLAHGSIKDPGVAIYELPSHCFVGAFAPDAPGSASDGSASWRRLPMDIDLALLRQLEPTVRQLVARHARLRAYWRTHRRRRA